MSERWSRVELLKPPPKNYHTVIIVGCGGVGSNFFLKVLRMEPKYIFLFDNDTLEVHNLTRVLLPEATVGRRKDIALSDTFGHYRQTLIIPMGEYKEGSLITILEAVGHKKGENILIGDFVDVAKVSNMIAREALLIKKQLKLKVSYVNANYDGWVVCARFYSHKHLHKIPMKSEEGEGGYRIVPTFVGTAELASTIAFLLAYTGTEASGCAETLGLLKLWGKIWDLTKKK